MYEKDGDDAQRSYQENVFVGIGRGDSREEAKEAAFENAWRRASSAGKSGKPLRIDGEWLSGTNPISWYKVVLVDDDH